MLHMCICVCSVSMHELFILQTCKMAYGHHRNLSPTTSVDRSGVLNPLSPSQLLQLTGFSTENSKRIVSTNSKKKTRKEDNAERSGSRPDRDHIYGAGNMGKVTFTATVEFENESEVQSDLPPEGEHVSG